MKLRNVMTPAATSRAYSSSGKSAQDEFKELHRPEKTDSNRVPLARSHVTARYGKINLRAVAEVLESKGLDPTVEIVRILQDPASNLSVDLKLKTLSTLMEYTHSKKKSVEITGADGGAIKVEQASADVLMRIAMSAMDADVLDVDAINET